MMGSGVFAGKLDLEQMLNTTDFEGTTIRAELGNDKTGDFGKRPFRPIAAYFEAHIEQGPILEDEGYPIGIVTGAQAQRWFDVTITGFESHAGPTPMTHRKDALAAAAEVTLTVEQIAKAEAPDGRGTVGTLSLTPFSRNVIPGTAQLTIDTRHPSNERLDAMFDQLRAACSEIAERRGVEIKLDEFWYSPMMPFNAQLIDSLEQCANARGVPSRQLWSGAGHDAVYVAAMGIPTAMLFIQTKDGISHNESESIQKDHAVIGCQVLCDAVVAALVNE
jgi:N-carbamoyl-L-amino-acid hydrolase